MEWIGLSIQLFVVLFCYWVGRVWSPLVGFITLDSALIRTAPIRTAVPVSIKLKQSSVLLSVLNVRWGGGGGRVSPDRRTSKNREGLQRSPKVSEGFRRFPKEDEGRWRSPKDDGDPHRLLFDCLACFGGFDWLLTLERSFASVSALIHAGWWMGFIPPVRRYFARLDSHFSGRSCDLSFRTCRFDLQPANIYAN